MSAPGNARPAVALLLIALTTSAGCAGRLQAPDAGVHTSHRMDAPVLAAPFAQLYGGAKAAIDLSSGDYEALSIARDQLVRVIQAYPDFAPAYVQLARAAFKLGQRGQTYDPESLRRARELVNRAIILAPDLAEARVVSAYVWAFEGVYDLSHEELERVRRLDPVEPRIDLARGYIARAQHRWDEAIAHYRSALGKSRDRNIRAEAYAGLGIVYRALNRHTDAKQAWEGLLEADPTSRSGLSQYGILLVNLGEHDKAIEFARMVKDSRNESIGRYLLGEAYAAKGVALLRREGRSEEGLRFFELALLEQPGTPMAHYGLGVYYYRLAREANDRSAALELLKRAIAHYRFAVRVLPDATWASPTLEDALEAAAALRRREP